MTKKKSLKKSHAVDYICSKYYDNRDILEDPDAMRVVRVYISERSKRLSQDLHTPAEEVNH